MIKKKLLRLIISLFKVHTYIKPLLRRIFLNCLRYLQLVYIDF